MGARRRGYREISRTGARRIIERDLYAKSCRRTVGTAYLSHAWSISDDGKNLQNGKMKRGRHSKGLSRDRKCGSGQASGQSPS